MIFLCSIRCDTDILGTERTTLCGITVVSSFV
jgi:hypothetical protein